jgi:hypothetical protein
MSSAAHRSMGISISSRTAGAICSKYSSSTAVAFGFAPRHTHHTARVGSIAKVLYPFHPLSGMELELLGSAAGDREVVYVRLPNSATRGIPAWMLDAAICSSVRMSERPIVSWSALCKLARLLEVHRAQNPTAADEHCTSPGPGCATTPTAAVASAARRPCSSISTTPDRDAREVRDTVRSIIARRGKRSKTRGGQKR